MNQLFIPVLIDIRLSWVTGRIFLMPVCWVYQANSNRMEPVFVAHTQWLQGTPAIEQQTNPAGDCICMCKRDNIHKADSLLCGINISRLNSLMCVINRAAFWLIYSNFDITILLVIGKIYIRLCSFQTYIVSVVRHDSWYITQSSVVLVV